jgi:TPR repeat protein
LPTPEESEAIAKRVAAENQKLTEQRAKRAVDAKEAAASKLRDADARAFALYLRRAESGDADSQHEVALRLLSGKGVEMDAAKARAWLEKSAAQNHTKAKQKLAELSGN